MSNNQWNSGQGSNEWAPQQGGSNEWGAQQEWNQQGSNQEWGQAQPQSSAQEWGQAQPQASAQDWNQQQGQASAGNDWGQGQQSAQDWNQQGGQQDWGQQGAQGGQQDWNQQQGQNWNQQQGGQYFPAQQGQFQGQPAERKASPFDFSFKQLSLPSAAGMIFMIGVIAVGVEWLFGFLQILVVGNVLGGAPSAMSIVSALVGGLAAALFKVLVLRVLIEIGVAGAKLLKKAEEPKDEA